MTITVLPDAYLLLALVATGCALVLRRRAPRLALLWAATALCWTLVFAHSVRAHEAPSGMRYDPECCSNMDCAPATSVTLHPDGSRTITNAIGLTATFPRSFPVRPSTDGKLHSCVSKSSGRPLCLYAVPDV